MGRFAAAAALLCLSLSPASAQSGQDLMERVVSAYRALSSCSYQGSSSAYVKAQGGTKTVGSTSVVRVQKPNRIYMAVTSPRVGTVTYACDGTTAIAYSSGTNQYIKRPAPATISAVIEELNRAANTAFGVQITALAFDALYFVEGRGLTPGVKWTRKGAEKVEGAPCDVVVGTPAKPSFKRATLWVDRASHLIRKSELLVTAPATQLGLKGKPTTRMDVTFAENAIGLKVNPPLKDADFQFNPPKGAVERNPEKYLKKP